MAEEKPDTRESAWRQLFPWTELFRCFKVAVDPNKLLLAAAGILLMAVGWWLLSVLFGAGYAAKPPLYGSSAFPAEEQSGKGENWKKYKAERNSWNLMHEAANIGGGDQRI